MLSLRTRVQIFRVQSIFFEVLIIIMYCCVVMARKHHLEVRNDMRPYIALSTFGFYTNGHLDVVLSKFTIDDEQPEDKFGLSLDKTTIDQMNPYLDSHQNKCILEEPSSMQLSGPILLFLMDLKNLIVRVQCSPEWKNFHIYKNLTAIHRNKRQSKIRVSDSALFMPRKRRYALEATDGMPKDSSNDELLDLTSTEQDNQIIKSNNKSITVVPVIKTAEIVNRDNGNRSVSVASPPTLLRKLSTQAKQNVTAQLSNKSKDKKPQDEKQDQQESKESKESEENVIAEEILQPKLPVASIAQYHEISSYRQPQIELCNDFTLPLYKEVINGVSYYNMTFSMYIATIRDEGLYNLYFHACPNYKQSKIISFNVDIEENNNGNYLSAGEMPLPSLYFLMSLLFFLSGLFWVFILKKTKYTVYKIHYIMAVLVFLKSLSLMFHSINYHFIEKRGEHVETWAILYYIAHLLKGAVLFITIVLIGTGWTFIKHILSDKDKKIFMIVIPLQVLANVAQIITDESDQSDAEFRTWRSIFFFVDLLCCGAILFPIVWSIRHLHEASATDGKAAINLRKLKLFRQFYIMIVCYVYFTRIIVDLLQMTVVFQYAWLDEMFREMATYVFFILTGYKFRPVSSHPYFTVPDDDADDEVEVLTESGLTETVHRTKPHNRNAIHTTTTIIEGNDDEREILIAKRELSHEYD